MLLFAVIKREKYIVKIQLTTLHNCDELKYMSKQFHSHVNLKLIHHKQPLDQQVAGDTHCNYMFHMNYYYVLKRNFQSTS